MQVSNVSSHIDILIFLACVGELLSRVIGVDDKQRERKIDLVSAIINLKRQKEHACSDRRCTSL